MFEHIRIRWKRGFCCCFEYAKSCCCYRHNSDERCGTGAYARARRARAIASHPAIIFADEPTGNLDAATGSTIIDLLFARRAASGATLVIITHDPALAARCERIITLADGRIASDTLGGAGA